MSIHATAVARVAYPPRAQLNFDPPFVLSLIAPAVLMSLMKKWAHVIAPTYGIFFTSMAVAILYGYYALARAVFVFNHSRDREGVFDDAKARKAEQDYYRLSRAKRATLVLAALALIAPATIADVLTMGRQTYHVMERVMGHIMLVEIVVWLWLGPAFVIACQRWTTLKPFNLTLARQIVAVNRGGNVRSSFCLATLLFAVASAFLIVTFYEPLRAILVSVIPSVRAIFVFSTLFYAVIAGFALWVHCVWSQTVAANLAEPPTDAPGRRG